MEKGWRDSITENLDSLEHWPGRGGRICLALENKRLMKFPEQGEAKERPMKGI